MPTRAAADTSWPSVVLNTTVINTTVLNTAGPVSSRIAPRHPLDDFEAGNTGQVMCLITVPGRPPSLLHGKQLGGDVNYR